MNTRTRSLIDGLFFLMAKELKNTDWWLDMNEMSEFVSGLIEQENWKAYENIKARLKALDLDEEEYITALRLVIEGLEL